MRVAIMQPYFFPYIGYFQLIEAVDLFIVYDNIKYTKKGWINRNRLLLSGKDATFSLPLKSDSDSLDVSQRELAASFDRRSLLNQFRSAYGHAPHFGSTWPLIEDCVQFADRNLFRYLHHALVRSCRHLEIDTEIVVSSQMDADHTLKGTDRVLNLCAAAGATSYLNSIGGASLYSTEAFRARGIKLNFLRPQPFTYRQFGAPFVPWLSIIDVMMFNALNEISPRLSHGFDLLYGSAMQSAAPDGSDD